MPATVQVRSLTGVAAATSTNISSGSLRYGTSDEVSPSTIPVPTSGSNYSYWRNVQLHATVAPDNALNNIKFWTDGGNGFGTGITATVGAASAYTQATGTAGSSGVFLNVANYATLSSGGASDLFAYTSSCKLTVAGSLGAATGSFGNRVVSQMSVISTASAGNTPEETMTWSWDES